MKQPQQLPFLARPGYRFRRLTEVIRLAPFVGVLLFLLPLLWTTGASKGLALTSAGWLYIFAAWFLLILANVFLARAYDRAGPSETAPDDERE